MTSSHMLGFHTKHEGENTWSNSIHCSLLPVDGMWAAASCSPTLLHWTSELWAPRVSFSMFWFPFQCCDKHGDQMQLGKKEVCLADTCRSITEGSQGRSTSRSWCKHLPGMLFTDLLPGLHSASCPQCAGTSRIHLLWRQWPQTSLTKAILSVTSQVVTLCWVDNKS